MAMLDRLDSAELRRLLSAAIEQLGTDHFLPRMLRGELQRRAIERRERIGDEPLDVYDSDESDSP